MTTLFQRHLSAEKTLADLREQCLELADRLDQEGADYEEVATAYAQSERYREALRMLQDFLLNGIDREHCE